MITLHSLHRYLVKSTRGEMLESAQVTAAGIALDRRWMVAEQTDQHPNRMITGRNDPRLVQVSVRAVADGLTLHAPDMTDTHVPLADFSTPLEASVWRDTFAATTGSAVADAWFSAYLGRPVRLLYTGSDIARRVRTHPDVPVGFADGYPLLLIHTASLADLSARIGRDMMAARFRPNLVVSGGEAFAEDGWRTLRIGDVLFSVAKPCSRCVFTTVDPQTGDKAADQEPLRTLSGFRRRQDGVMFGLNLVAEGRGTIECGMPVEIVA
ncbi:MAG: MOSC domain-containing protein [Rhodocyclaceae bacterium]